MGWIIGLLVMLAVLVVVGLYVRFLFDLAIVVVMIFAGIIRMTLSPFRHRH